MLSDLDSLGAGFQLASHDLDIRGAGNLLGDEQSGHIKEVGYELYQSMLEEAILEAKAGGAFEKKRDFSPQITVDAPILIPDDYVPISTCAWGCIVASTIWKSTRKWRNSPPR